MIAGERDGYGLPAVVRGDTDSRKPELSADLVHQWVIHQACKEGRAEQDRKVKIQFAECGVSIEVPIAPTVAASLLGVVTIVLLGVIGYQWRLLRLARLDRIRNSGSAEAREARTLPPSATVVGSVGPTVEGPTPQQQHQQQLPQLPQQQQQQQPQLQHQARAELQWVPGRPRVGPPVPARLPSTRLNVPAELRRQVVGHMGDFVSHVPLGDVVSHVSDLYSGGTEV